MSKDTLHFLDKLIGFKSITPHGEDAINYVANLLNKFGFICDVKNFGSGVEKVTNLYAILGNSTPNICFAGHLDVVSPSNEILWSSDPFKMKIQDNFVYGRGAVDMKGAIACSLAAVKEFLNSNKNPNGSISFLFTTDEEGEAKHGTKEMLEYIKDKYNKIDFCILGEPTSKHQVGDTIKIGRRGSINYSLKVIKKQGHVAYPEKAMNPIPVLVGILGDLIKKELDTGSKYFQKSNLEITSIDTGNFTSNIIPESMTAKFNIRFNDHHTTNDLNSIITQIISKHVKDYDLKYSSSSSPFIQEYSPRMQKFTQIVKNVCKITPNIETSGGTSDARFIYLYSEVVELGLICDLAHKINEYTQISDLQTLYNVYYSTLVKFL